MRTNCTTTEERHGCVSISLTVADEDYIMRLYPDLNRRKAVQTFLKDAVRRSKESEGK